MIDLSRLETVPLLAGLTRGALHEVATRSTVLRFRRAETLWRSGAASRGLFVVLAGEVRITASRQGRSHRVHTEGAGATLGEVPLFDGRSYPATAVAVSDVECLVVSRATLAAAVAEDPELAFRLMSGMAGRLRALIGRLDALVAADVCQRLAMYLVHEWEASPDDVVRLRGNRTDLADEIGTVREVVARALRRFEIMGIVERDGRSLRVTDGPGLRAMARLQGSPQPSKRGFTTLLNVEPKVKDSPTEMK